MTQDTERPTRYDIVINRLRDENREFTGHTVALFARHDTGMILAAVQDKEVFMGEDPNATVRRSFLTHEQAMELARHYVRQWAGRDDVDFLVSDGESTLVVPARAVPQRRRM